MQSRPQKADFLFLVIYNELPPPDFPFGFLFIFLLFVIVY